MASPAKAKISTKILPMVDLKDIRKSFGDLEVVKGLDLEIGSGEFFSLLGPSGCGKTTLLRMIAGFETPNSGVVSIAGQEMTNFDANERPTNMVFQSYAIFPHLSVGDNVAYGLKKKGLSKNELKKRVDDMLKLVDLEGLYDRPSFALSGGQKQRVALARALIMQPKVLLLDEPTSSLDPKISREIMTLVKEMAFELRVPCLCNIHDVQLATEFCNKIVGIQEGTKMFEGDPNNLSEEKLNEIYAMEVL